MKKAKVYLLSLGCSRNLVDSEIILGVLKDNNYSLTFDLKEATVAILNTCCFIDEAKEETIEYIFELVSLKKQKRLRKILVIGCFPQRYAKNIQEEIPEVDGLITFDRYLDIHKAIDEVLAGKKVYWLKKNPQFLYNHKMPRFLLTPAHYAYIKISEGCNHNCSFCIIPKIKGKYRSRRIESILYEAESLIKKGVKEIILIGQDTSAYGIDIYKKPQLDRLLKEIVKLKDLRWLRILYTHPVYFNDALIESIKKYDNICKYADIPLQHINQKILKLMARTPTPNRILKLIKKLRKEIPGIAIRTSLIVGFPEETESDFRELIDFVKEVKFERLGAFKYSKEEGTRAYNFKKQVPDKIKQQRFKRIMEIQRDISSQINKKFLGKKMDIIIDEKAPHEKNLYLGRTQYDAPEVDGMVYLKAESQEIKPGDIIPAVITDTYEYDLVAEPYPVKR